VSLSAVVGRMRATAGPIAVIVLTISLAAACAARATAGPRETVSLTVFAAASMRDALEAVQAAYEASHPDIHLTISTGSSAALATQIEQGARADVFLSADEANARRVAVAGLTVGDLVPFAANELAIVTPTDDPGAVAAPPDLGRAGVRIIAAGVSVPITRYAMQLVENLTAVPGYPPAFAAAYESNVVTREEDVQAVVTKILLGEGDAAIVYRTDAVANPALRTIALPAGANVRATYLGARIAGSTQAAPAAGFLDWLAGPEGQATLGRFGFTEPVG